MQPALDQWIQKIRDGDARALARALSEVENGGSQAGELLRALFPFSGKAAKIGITGAPGAGKSSLVDRLAAALRREGKTVGIVAVDPSSPYSGGAILGDRIRMQAHASDPGIFIRSMATRGFLGGLARATGDAALVLDAAGRDVVLIETVGVGQDEVEVVKLAGVVALVLAPGMGDDVQTLKAGILEIADVFVINKADRDGADRLEQELRAMLEIAHRPDGWTPPIVRTIATEDRGTAELLGALRSCRFPQRAVSNWKSQLAAMLRDRLLERAMERALGDGELEAAAAAVAERRRDPYEFVEEVVRRYERAAD
ncbi:MAG TPA: methylmalonyl Co-A mutase-associated GTPase MeaB [Bryobacterales bacterium]|nr:methylmalonyl Co-A mutase-associated GTPase MeaB [Bryobacterales bacterium]